VKCGVGVLYRTLSSKLQFCENRLRGGRTLLKGLKEFLPCCPCVWPTGLGDFRCEGLNIMSCIKIGARKAVRLLLACAVACYCVTECTVCSGVLLRHGVHYLQWRVIAWRSALFAVACYCHIRSFCPWMNSQQVRCQPVLISETQQTRCAYNVTLRRVRKAAVVAMEKQYVLHIVSVCL